MKGFGSRCASYFGDLARKLSACWRGWGASEGPDEEDALPAIGEERLSFLVVSPERLLQRLEESAKRCQLDPVPRCSDRPWTCGYGSVRGQVRRRNEDYALSFELEGIQVGLVADGLGGLRFGDAASYIATRSAAWYLVQYLNRSSKRVATVDKALRAAAMSLVLVARRFGISPSRDLRTTLTICLGDERHWTVGYCGDGGVCVVRQSGEVVPFMVPQKTDPRYLNVVSASLGPTPHGRPCLDRFAREPGDLLIGVSDGVADRVDPSFPVHSVLRRAVNHGGNLQNAIDEILDELASLEDEKGVTYDDNMSMILLGDGILDHYIH